MPLYDFHCLTCDTVEEKDVPFEDRHSQVCKTGEHLVHPVAAPSTVMFERGWYEHIAPEPIFCDSARELKEACDKHDAYSPYLESSPWRRGL